MTASVMGGFVASYEREVADDAPLGVSVHDGKRLTQLGVAYTDPPKQVTFSFTRFQVLVLIVFFFGFCSVLVLCRTSADMYVI